MRSPVLMTFHFPEAAIIASKLNLDASGGQCYDSNNIFAEKSVEKIEVCSQN
jgi:hypothetical protein